MAVNINAASANSSAISPCTQEKSLVSNFIPHP
jgi:hypothetical protein